MEGFRSSYWMIPPWFQRCTSKNRNAPSRLVSPETGLFRSRCRNSGTCLYKSIVGSPFPYWLNSHLEWYSTPAYRTYTRFESHHKLRCTILLNYLVVFCKKMVAKCWPNWDLFFLELYQGKCTENHLIHGKKIRERTTVGGGVVKVLILQFFWDMEMVCTWSHKSRLSRILHFLQRCCLFPRMLYVLFSTLEKNTCLYTMILMPLQWILHCIVVHIAICMYIYCIYTHYLTHLLFFHNSLCFSINMYLILNTHECNFQLQILHFLKSVLHSFMLFMSAFQKITCPDWTCTSSKDGLTTIESRPFPGIIYIVP